MEQRRISVGVAAALVVGALGIGLVVGLATSGGADDNGAAKSKTATIGPKSTKGGVPVGYEQSRAGAVAAVSNYQGVLNSPLASNDKKVASAARVMATPTTARDLTKVFQDTNRGARQTSLGKSLRDGSPTVVQGSVLGYRVVSYSDSKARIALWTTSVVGNTIGFDPVASWQTLTYDVAWSDGDWKLDGFDQATGPTPSVEGTRPPTAPEKFVRETSRLKGFVYAP